MQKTNESGFVGPNLGSLVIVGGGAEIEPILERFIELAGGCDARIVAIPTAAGLEHYGDQAAQVMKMRDLGASNVALLHTNERAVADTDVFVKPLENATGVWFGGGRQWRLVDAYKGTKTEAMFWQVLARGGVIGGTSAGATIQGTYLARGDTQGNHIMMGDHEEGFGFLKDVAIDQHLLARNRHFDLFEILEQRPELLGIGIDEDTGIIVKGNEFEVVGKSYVAMYDGTYWSCELGQARKLSEEDERFYFLREGDRYNLKERRVIVEK